jgi:MFS family permease
VTLAPEPGQRVDGESAEALEGVASVSLGRLPGGELEGASLERARRRATWLLVAAAALGSVANIAAVTVVGIAAREILDDPALAGASTTTVILGAAAGTSLLAWLMVRSSRRLGLAVGLAIGVAGALVAAWSVAVGSFVALLGGTLLFGFGNASTQLARYTAADMAPPARRAHAISLVVWAGTVGAVVGPNLMPVAAAVSDDLGMADLAGPFLLAALIMSAASLLLFALLRPDPYELADVSSRIETVEVARQPMRRILRRPPVAMAVIALVVGQVVMIGIMTMTPLHMDGHGHDLGAVGLVISAHTLGMFAFSPLSGRIAGRIGSVPTILLAAAVLAVAAGMAAAAPSGGPLLGLALFLLGYGWNLGFVAGSTLLVSGVSHAERTRTEGASDSIVWASSAAASLGSGVVVAVTGFGMLGLFGLALVGAGVLAIVRLRPRLSPEAAPS